MTEKRRYVLPCVLCVMLLLPLLLPTPASAQSCALCYTQAASSGPRLIRAMRKGILVLIFPPMLICVGISMLAYRKRNCFISETHDLEERHLGW